MIKSLVGCVIMCVVVSVAMAEGEQTTGTMLRAAIFVQNHAGKDFQDKVDSLNDFATSRLTEKGFSIINKNDVIAKFKESRDDIAKMDADLKEAQKKPSAEAAVAQASALRLSQMLDADYFVIVSMASYGTEKKKFNGAGTIYKTDNEVMDYNMRLTIKVLEANQGGSVYGNSITATERVALTKNLEVESSDTINKLLDNAAAKIAEDISGHVEKIRNVKVKSVSVVEFSVKSNVEGADVLLDGVTIGTVRSDAPTKFRTAPGIHTMQVAQEGFITWDRTVNIINGQVLEIKLEMTPEGLDRWKSIEKFNLEMVKHRQDIELEKKEREANVDIAKEQSTAQAKATVLKAEGEKALLEKSKISIDKIDKLNIDAASGSGKSSGFSASDILGIVSLFL